MKARIDQNELVKHTLSITKNGTRDLRDATNLDKYNRQDQNKFIVWNEKAGILPEVTDLEKTQFSFYKNVTPVTTFLLSNRGYISTENSRVKTLELASYPADTFEPVTENKSAQLFLEDLINV